MIVKRIEKIWRHKEGQETESGGQNQKKKKRKTNAEAKRHRWGEIGNARGRGREAHLTIINAAI